jgi:hypothetical protein
MAFEQRALQYDARKGSTAWPNLRNELLARADFDLHCYRQLTFMRRGSWATEQAQSLLLQEQNTGETT